MSAPPVPVLLVGGFLGAGKTTVVNHLLAHAGGRRVAAVVNDFGDVNIDAELLEGAAEGVVSLPGGCICCKLEGDLLRTLSLLLRQAPRPERIVIETSGVADPAEVVRNLMDPVIWAAAPLETVLTVVDATAPPASWDDPLFRAQLRAADIVALTRLDLCPDPAPVRAAIAASRPGILVVDAPFGAVSPTLLFPDGAPPPSPRPVGRRSPVADRFESLAWTGDAPLSLPRLQAAITRLAPRLARAKGFFEPANRPGTQMLLQLAGGRATLAPAGTRPPGAPLARLVFIAEIGTLDAAAIAAAMNAAMDDGPAREPPSQA